MSTQAELPTVRAVLAYAEALRKRAEQARAQDPYARPYDPSDAVARKVYATCLGLVNRSDEAAEVQRPDEEVIADASNMAISELVSRVALKERNAREEREVAERAERRHARRQRLARAEEQARNAGLSLGVRLDRAINALGMLSETAAQAMREDPVKGTPDRHATPQQAPRDDRYSTLIADARHLVFRLEEELDHARRRRVKETA